MGVAPSHLGLSARFAARRGLGGEQPRPATREIPLTERRMVLSPTQPKTLSPADPCNKVLLVAITAGALSFGLGAGDEVRSETGTAPSEAAQPAARENASHSRSGSISPAQIARPDWPPGRAVAPGESRLTTRRCEDHARPELFCDGRLSSERATGPREALATDPRRWPFRCGRGVLIGADRDSTV
jgi:hypothetical protein